MTTPNTWEGYSPDFMEGFSIPIPIPFSGKWKNDLAINKDTRGYLLPFINYSSVQSVSRRLPLLTASNIFRENWVQAARTGSFKTDERLEHSEQFSTKLYKAINKKQMNSERKIAKGHMVRRGDVQWDINKLQDNAVNAAKATFRYTNACPQHQAVNNVIWKNLETSILTKGRSRDPKKVIVFTGPVLDSSDPWLVTNDEEQTIIQCPLRFWKVIYYVTLEHELRYAAFLMSQKEEVEEDGYVSAEAGLEISKSPLKPFLDFEEKEKYQVNISLVERLTGLKFTSATEALPKGEKVKLTKNIKRRLKGQKGLEALRDHTAVNGLVL